ncbi:hypothetical protein GLAREA_06724 [Glarea lozoyensis ATCC 20868]|uniref:Uncharacterized protein n=1 Tax=Glarea lozoyensis (strain ATCC 20868 / MF5171) TaxID=1116229 RepID=S3DNN7_GLAL2|nr:uncharacterized protein GLAREA_06724 [Glarea lozoyensis ATCC 20868]EPE33711.1 hypothetical protein GLAREA_06724 [Glarea lozoyensis ATCC 20868]
MINKETNVSKTTAQLSSTARQSTILPRANRSTSGSPRPAPPKRKLHSKTAPPQTKKPSQKLISRSSSSRSSSQPSQSVLALKTIPPPNKSTAPAYAPEKKPTFTQSQLALALTISKSRPEQLSTSDYCQQLRKRIKTGNNVQEDEHRYVDSTSFWKDQYQHIHQEKEFLEDKLNRLQEANRLLEDSAHQSESSSQHISTVEQLIENAIRSGAEKRKPPYDEGPLPLDLSITESATDNHLLRMSSCVFRINRQRGNLEKITALVGNDLDYLVDTIDHANKLLALLETHLLDCCTPLRLVSSANVNPRILRVFEHFMHQLSLGYQLCFDSLNEICRTMLGRTKKNDIIYRMTRYIQKAIAFLHDISLAQEYKESKAPRRQGSNGHDGIEYIVNKHLAISITSMLAGLEWEAGKPGHSELLEGILYTILQHTGKLVSVAVFNEHVASSKNEGKVTENTQSGEVCTAKFESRYIIQILYTAIGGATKTELISQVLAAGRSNMSKDGKGDLISKARKLLQSTLINNSTGGVSLETLRLPPPPSEDTAIPDDVHHSVERYSSEWLVEMAWALVGWDMVI